MKLSAVSFKNSLVNKTTAGSTASAQNTPAKKQDTKPQNNVKPEENQHKTSTAKTAGIITGAVALAGLGFYGYSNRAKIAEYFKGNKTKIAEELKEQVETQGEKLKKGSEEVLEQVNAAAADTAESLKTVKENVVAQVKEQSAEIKGKILDIIDGLKINAEKKAAAPAVNAQTVKETATEAVQVAEEVKETVASEVKKAVVKAETPQVKIEEAGAKTVKKGKTKKTVEKTAEQTVQNTANPGSQSVEKAAVSIEGKAADTIEELLKRETTEQQKTFRGYWQEECDRILKENHNLFYEQDAYLAEIGRIAKIISEDKGRFDAAQQGANLLEQAYHKRFIANDVAHYENFPGLIKEVSKPNNPLIEMYSKMEYSEAIDRLVAWKNLDLTKNWDLSKGKENEVFKKALESLQKKLAEKK